MTEKRKFPRYDCDIFENNGLEDASAIMQLFDRKNKRVNRIFDCADNTGEENNEQNKSYNLHLISTNESNSNKENFSAKTSENSIRNIRALSPVDIIPVNNEEISDSKTDKPFKEPRAKILPGYISLRRSLFQKPNSIDRQLICSTPMTQRVCRQESFFNATETTENISPIRKNSSDKNQQVIKNTQEIAPIQKATSSPELADALENVPVPSLAVLENDLQDQYQMQIQKTPKRKSRCTSRLSEKLPSSQPNEVDDQGLNRMTPTSTKSEKIRDMSIQTMDMSEEIISKYRLSQIRRLSLSNQTDVNSVSVVETPITRRHQNIAKCDSALAKKLRQCETDSDMTDDESNDNVPGKSTSFSQKKSSESKKKSQTQQCSPVSSNININKDTEQEFNHKTTADKTENKKDSRKKSSRKQRVKRISISESSDNERENDELLEEMPEKNNELPQDAAKGNSTENETDTETSKKSSSTVVFKKPSLSILSKKSNRPKSIITANPLNDSVHVSQSVVESLANLCKVNDECSTSSQTLNQNQSKRFTLPKRKNSKKNQESHSKASEYLKLSTRSKTIKKNKNDGKTKKRTLYIQNSMTDNEIDIELDVRASQNKESSVKSYHSKRISQSNDQDANKIQDSDSDLLNTVDEIRKSLETASITSTEFSAKIVDERNKHKPEKKNTRKRNQLPSSSEAKPAKQRKKNNNEPKEICDVESSSESNNNDEGFGSDENIDNIKYDPNEKGCPRRGLRVRRFPRAWWRHDAESNNYGLIYGCYNKDDYRAEIKLKKVITKKRITPTQIFVQGLTPSVIDPVNALKKAEDLKTQNKQVPSRVTRTKVNSKKNTEIPISKKHDDVSVSNSSDHLSTCTFKTAHTRSEVINKVFDSYSAEENDKIQSISKTTQAYDLQQINKIKWTSCGSNVLFHQFVDHKNDGFIKFLPGAAKSKAKTKHCVLKFVLLSGKVDFYINDNKETLENLGYISIQPGNTYFVRNPYEEPAIMSFTKLESSIESGLSRSISC